MKTARTSLGAKGLPTGGPIKPGEGGIKLDLDALVDGVANMLEVCEVPKYPDWPVSPGDQRGLVGVVSTGSVHSEPLIRGVKPPVEEAEKIPVSVVDVDRGR